MVQEIQEFYGDIFAINQDTFTLNMQVDCGFNPVTENWIQQLERIDEGLLSCLLSLKVRPYIRAQKSSFAAMQIARDIEVVGTKNNTLLI